MEQEISKLINAGLSEIEAKVYLTIISKGVVNGSEIADMLELERTVVYRGLKRLLSKGIISSTNESYARKYYIEDTSKLTGYIEKDIYNKQKSLTQVRDLIDNLPFVSFDSLLKSKVKIYKGEDAIAKIYEDRLSSTEPILRELSTDLVFPGLSKRFWNSMIRKRKKSELFLQQLVDSKDQSVDFHRTNKDQFKEVRVVPSDFIMKSGINIYGNKVAFHNGKLNDSLAIIIEDIALAESMKNIFDFVWNRSKVI